jgi:hypothetical protein
MSDDFQTVVQALANLRTYAKRYPAMGLSEAVNTLDNAGVFAALDEQTDYASAEEILAESALDDLEQKSGRWAVAPVPETAVSRPAGEPVKPWTASELDAADRAAEGRLGRRALGLERVPGTDTLQPRHIHAGCGLDCDR